METTNTQLPPTRPKVGPKSYRVVGVDAEGNATGHRSPSLRSRKKAIEIATRCAEISAETIRIVECTGTRFSRMLDASGNEVRS